MALFVFPECFQGEIARIVVDELVALGTEEHQIADIVDVCWPSPLPSPGPSHLKGDDMGHLGKVAFGQSHVVFKQIFVAAVELTATACTDEKQEPSERRYAPCLHKHHGRVQLGLHPPFRVTVLFARVVFMHASGNKVM
jgi:hypothetical protein